MNQQNDKGAPHDICKCGDYRKSHENGAGPCYVCVSGTTRQPWPNCKEFRFSHSEEVPPFNEKL